MRRLPGSPQASGQVAVAEGQKAGKGDSSVGSLAQPAHSWLSEPTGFEVVLLGTVVWVVGFLVVSAFEPFWERVRLFGDTAFYVDIAIAIRHWNLETLNPYHFWGLPYLIALVHLVTSLSPWWSLLLICASASLASVYLVWRLWGGWVAAYFVVLSLEWQQRTLLGGAEPLFVLLIIGSLALARRDRWYLSSLLAALATIVRPLGLFALVAIAVVLLYRREYQRVAGATLIGLVIGAAYMTPMVVYYGDPLANYRYYQTQDWGSAWPVGLPFVAIVEGLLAFDLPMTSRLRSGFWILLFVAASVTMIRSHRFREYSRRCPVETVFAALYIAFVFSYNAPVWAWVEFARFALPAVPIALYALADHLPKDRRLIWALAPVSAALAAISAMNLRRVLSLMRSALPRT